MEKVLSSKEVLHNPKNQKMIDFLIKLIGDSSAALECPVCLETTQEPTYQCLESHLICSKCRPNVDSCPICQVPYNGLLMRNRTAEENSRKLAEMITKRGELFLEDEESR